MLRASLPVFLALGVLGAPRGAGAEAIRAGDEASSLVDWTTGELSARGVGLADRRAPSPATARDAAKVRAIADARTQLAVAARALPWAPGGTLGDRLADAALAAVLERAQLRAAEPLVDGSWRVSLTIPLETLRQAVVGARPVELPQAPRGPSGAHGKAPALPMLVVRIDDRAPAGAAPFRAPALGLEVTVGATALRGPVLWARGELDGVPLPAAARGRAPTVDGALVVRGGALSATAQVPAGKAAATDATLVVVVLGQK